MSPKIICRYSFEFLRDYIYRETGAVRPSFFALKFDTNNTLAGCIHNYNPRLT